MSQSRTPRKKPAKAGKSAAKGGRLLTVGLFATVAVVAALIGSLAYGLRGERGDAARAASPSPARPSTVAPAGRVRVEVLNASGRPGLARQATEVLRDRGFDVVNYANAQGYPPDSSLVLDRVGKMEDARRVADAVSIRRVLARPDANLYLDVTVVLGRDWRPPADSQAPDGA
jgi:hypothetical protein